MPPPTHPEITIQSSDYWFKVVDFLQQNWALIEVASDGVLVRFISDSSGVFDEMTFPSLEDATKALRNNGFNRLAENAQAAGILRPPAPPFRASPHPNGPIYSSGRFWR